MSNHLAELSKSNCVPLSIALIVLKENVQRMNDGRIIINLADLQPVMLVHEVACQHRLTICRSCLSAGWAQDYDLFTPVGMRDKRFTEITRSIKATKRILCITDWED